MRAARGGALGGGGRSDATAWPLAANANVPAKSQRFMRPQNGVHKEFLQYKCLIRQRKDVTQKPQATVFCTFWLIWSVTHT